MVDFYFFIPQPWDASNTMWLVTSMSARDNITGPVRHTCLTYGCSTCIDYPPTCSESRIIVEPRYTLAVFLHSCSGMVAASNYSTVLLYTIIAHVSGEKGRSAPSKVFRCNITGRALQCSTLYSKHSRHLPHSPDIGSLGKYIACSLDG